MIGIVVLAIIKTKIFRHEVYVKLSTSQEYSLIDYDVNFILYHNQLSLRWSLKSHFNLANIG